MLNDQSLPFLWEEACNTVVYLQNKNPHRILGCKLLKRHFQGRSLKWGTLGFLGALLTHMSLMRRGLSCTPLQKRGSLWLMMRLRRAIRFIFLLGDRQWLGGMRGSRRRGLSGSLLSLSMKRNGFLHHRLVHHMVQLLRVQGHRSRYRFSVERSYGYMCTSYKFSRYRYRITNYWFSSYKFTWYRFTRKMWYFFRDTIFKE